MADVSPQASSDGGSSSDLYGTPPLLDQVPPSRPASSKRKSQTMEDNDSALKRVRLQSPNSSIAAPPSRAPLNGHPQTTRPSSRPNSRPTSSHPIPGTWNSRPGSVSSLAGLPGPSMSANPTNSRNQQEGNERKAARKADIERRCRQLDPPLLPNVLHRMSTFNAATQIGFPLNDQGWETLKSKLLAERSSVEEIVREEERVISQARADLALAQARAATADTDEDLEASSEPRLSLRDAREAEAREWAAAQAPMRDRLGPIADDYIREQWSDGRFVTYENSPQFAADCLIQVRRKYFSSDVHGSDDIPGPLVLDAMKWVYDTKIKPIAENHRKDLFLCNSCDSGMKAFEGCIQHFAAKHTSSLSFGTQVVAWHTAMWPESPPFAPDPLEPRSQAQPPFAGYFGAQYQASHPHRAQPIYPPPAFPPASYAGHHHPMHPSHQSSPGPYGNPAYAEQYSYYMPGPYGGPPYSGHVPPASPPNGQYPYHQPPPPYTPGPSHGWAVPQYPPHMYSPPSPGYAYPPPGPPYQGSIPYGSGPVTGTSWNPAPGPPGQNLYQAQREELSKTANEIWSSISDVKDIPPSVRVYTVLSQAVSIFRSRFKNEPSLDLVSDCVISSPLMTPLKNANGLACKTCVLSNEDLEEPHSSAFQFHSGGRKLYPFHSLLQHFKNVHIEGGVSRKSPPNGNSETPPRLDWKEDMIELPEDSLVGGLVNARNMDNHKLRVLAGAFPSIFPSYVSRASSAAYSDTHDNEYDPRNPLMISSGWHPQSSESSPGRARHISHQNEYLQPLGKRKRQVNQDINAPTVKLEDGEDYRLVPVGRHTDSRHRGSAPRHIRLDSDHGHGSSADAANNFLEELEMEPRFREGAQYSRPVPHHAVVRSGDEEDYRDPRAFSKHPRSSYYDGAQDEPVEYVYMPPPPPPPPPRASYNGYPHERPSQRLFVDKPIEYRDGQVHGVSRQRRDDHF